MDSETNFRSLIDEICIMKDGLKTLQEKVGDITVAVSEICNKVQLLDVAEQLKEMMEEIRQVWGIVVDLKRNIVQVVDSKCVNNVGGGCISSDTVVGRGTPVRFNAFDELWILREKLLSNNSTPKGPYLKEGSDSIGRDYKYGKRRSSAKKMTVAVRNPIIGKLIFDTSPSGTSKAIGKSFRKVAIHRAGPFNIERSLAPLDLQLLNYAFDEYLDKTEILVELNFNDLTRAGMESLKFGKWIDGEVISCICETLMLEKSRDEVALGLNCFVTPRYSDVVMHRGEEWKNFVKNHYIKERYLSNLLECNKAFFPMLDMANHWFLMMVDMRLHKVEIWDSYPTNSRKIPRKKMCEMVLVSLDFLFETSRRKTIAGSTLKFQNFEIIHREDAPRQNNGIDCGMYVICFMQDMCTKSDSEFKFDSHQRRCDLSLELLKSRHNKKWETLEYLANEFKKTKSSQTSDGVDRLSRYKTGEIKRKKSCIFD